MTEWRYTNSKHTKTYSSLGVLAHYYVYKEKMVDWNFCREQEASKAVLGKSNCDCICRAARSCRCLILEHLIFKLWYCDSLDNMDNLFSNHWAGLNSALIKGLPLPPPLSEGINAVLYIFTSGLLSHEISHKVNPTIYKSLSRTQTYL